MIDLKGHAALVTGSSKGVGHAIAVAWAAAGADVLVHGRQRSEAAEAAMDACRGHGVDVDFVGGDLGGPTEAVVERVFRDAVERFEHLDLLVNNAGQYFDLPFERMTHERFEQTMRLNVWSPYFLTQSFANHWIERGTGGRVLMIGSINGDLAEQDSTAYDISKGALGMMVKTLAVALAPRGIRVNGLAPGLVRTAQTTWLDERTDHADWVAHHTPNGRIPDAAVCGPGAVYLLSDEADHVHGHMLLVDGGMAAWQFPLHGPWQRKV